MDKISIRRTSTSKLIGVIRIMLGVMFVMTGIMKIAVSKFGAAWSLQLIEAEILLSNLVYRLIPIVEVLIGVTMLAGYYSRIGALIIMPIMLVGIYVHLTVSNPGAFPAQPREPYVPILVLGMAFLF